MTYIQRVQDSFLFMLWRMVSARPALVVICGLLLAAVAGTASSMYLRLNSDQDALVSPDVPHQKQYLASIKNFGDQEYVFAVIRTGGNAKGKARAAEFAEAMAARLAKHPDQIRAVHYKITAADLGESALLFAPEDEAEKLAGMVTTFAHSANAWMADPTLAGILNQFNNLMENAGALSNDQSDNARAFFEQGMTFASDLVADMHSALSGEKAGRFGIHAADAGHYFFTDNNLLLVMRILPAKDFSTLGVVTGPLNTIRDAMEQTQKEISDVDAGLTGRPVLSNDEMETTNTDMTRASIIAVILVGLLFMLVMHGLYRPILVMVSLCAAIAWTYGFALLTIGELNLLSIVFALILVGIGVDFGIHIAMRHAEGINQGLAPDDAVKDAMLSTGPGIMLGAITSVCAFFVVLGSDFQGLADLGLIGGAGILFCLLSMLTMLPAFLLIAGRKNLFKPKQHRATTLSFMVPVTKRPARLLIGLMLLSIALLGGLYRTGFSYNLLELQADGLDSIHWEHVLMNESEESTWFAILAADDLDHARELTARLMDLPQVAKVESVLDYIPSNQTSKAAAYAKAAEALHFPEYAVPEKPVNADELADALEDFRHTLENLEEKLFSAGAKGELAVLQDLLDNVDDLEEVLSRHPGDAGRLDPLQKKVRKQLSGTLTWLEDCLSAETVDTSNLPPAIRDLYVGKDGRFQIKVVPKENVWDFSKLETFVHALREVDPAASGVPVGVYESSRLMHDTFLSAAGWTLALVVLILWLNSRSIRSVLFTLIPLVVGILWLLEGMGWLGLNFNLANFFAIPVLIAIGVDGGVHLLARWQELAMHPSQEPMAKRLFATSTPMAVTLSFLTTMIGFGGLLLAHHKGLGSLGSIMVLGSLTCMLGCLLVLPSILLRLHNPSK